MILLSKTHARPRAAHYRLQQTGVRSGAAPERGERGRETEGGGGEREREREKEREGESGVCVSSL